MHDCDNVFDSIAKRTSLLPQFSPCHSPTSPFIQLNDIYICFTNFTTLRKHAVMHAYGH